MSTYLPITMQLQCALGILIHHCPLGCKVRMDWGVGCSLGADTEQGRPEVRVLLRYTTYQSRQGLTWRLPCFLMTWPWQRCYVQVRAKQLCPSVGTSSFPREFFFSSHPFSKENTVFQLEGTQGRKCIWDNNGMEEWEKNSRAFNSVYHPLIQ